MSKGKKKEYAWAKFWAYSLVQMIEPHVKRVKIAGSIRREDAMIGDIELVVEPDLLKNLFGEQVNVGEGPLDIVLKAMVKSGLLKKGRLNGVRMKQFYCPNADMNVDVFIVIPPDQWGIKFLNRTGPLTFSKWIVKSQMFDGAMPLDMKQTQNQLINTGTGEVYPVPEEEDYFRLIGLDYIEPKKRF